MEYMVHMVERAGHSYHADYVHVPLLSIHLLQTLRNLAVVLPFILSS